MKKNTIRIIIVFIILSQLSVSCKDTGIQPPEKVFTIAAEDVSCTEVWLKIKVGPGNLNREVALKRDTIILFTRILNDIETIAIDTNLLPNHTYTYTAQLLSGSLTSSSTARTMDTTNHAFTWQTFTLGDGSGSSCLYDVAIINDTLTYAVGQIYRNDTTFNVAKWDGQEWKLMKIQFLYFCNQSDTFPFPANAIWAFSENDIWIASGSQIVRWNGQSQTQPTCIPVSVNKLWGENQNSIYAVGVGGSIAHYSSGSWTKIESGTNLQFLDIYGATDPRTGEQQILAVCTQNYPGNRGIFSIKENNATQISSEPIAWELFSVWFVPNRHYYVVGGDYYEKSTLYDNGWKKFYPPTRYAASSMRGIGLNDAIIVGASGECLHWNGVSWKSYINNGTGINGAYGSVQMRGNFIMAVGFSGSKAYATIGRR